MLLIRHHYSNQLRGKTTQTDRQDIGRRAAMMRDGQGKSGRQTYAALILRRLDGGWPWLWTKRIGRGGGPESGRLLSSVVMARP
jgi:hypothetical protein